MNLFYFLEQTKKNTHTYTSVLYIYTLDVTFVGCYNESCFVFPPFNDSVPSNTTTSECVYFCAENEHSHVETRNASDCFCACNSSCDADPEDVCYQSCLAQGNTSCSGVNSVEVYKGTTLQSLLRFSSFLGNSWHLAELSFDNNTNKSMSLLFKQMSFRESWCHGLVDQQLIWFYVIHGCIMLIKLWVTWLMGRFLIVCDSFVYYSGFTWNIQRREKHIIDKMYYVYPSHPVIIFDVHVSHPKNCSCCSLWFSSYDFQFLVSRHLNPDKM